MKQDHKVFGMYRSMILGEGGKIKSIPFKHTLIFVGLVVCAGLIFRFDFMEIFYNMNKHNIGAPVSVIDDVQGPQQGLKIVKIIKSSKRNLRDEIKIEKLYFLTLQITGCKWSTAEFAARVNLQR